MPIPARTSSAPPNLDEHKQAQARHDSFKAMPTTPIPSAPKQQQQQQQQQQQTRKDVGSHNKSNTGEFHPPTQTKRDMHVPISSIPTSLPPKQSVLPIGAMQVHMPFQQPQISMQFGGPSPQMQSQGVTANSLQMTMAMPMINGPQVPQQMFVHNFQSHPLQQQALMHQGQSMGFAPQMGHQLPSQLSNMGFGISPQFTQQPGNFGGPRKTTVKITHPDTHEELRLDKRTDSHVDGGVSSQRPLSSVTAHSQPIQTFDPSHQMSYYPPLQPSSYSPFFSAPNSHPLTTTQMTTGAQGPRFSYPIAQSGQTMSFLRPPPTFHGVSEAANLEVPPVPATSAPVQVTIKPAVTSSLQKTGAPSVIISMPRSNVDAPKLLKPQGHANVSPQNKDDETVLRSVREDSKSAEPQGNASLLVTDLTVATSAPPTERIQPGTSTIVTSVVDSIPIGSATEGSKRESIQTSDSLEDKKTTKKDASHTQQHTQTTAPNVADFAISSSKVIEDRSNVSAQEVRRFSETSHSLFGSDSPTAAAKLPSSNEEHASSVECQASEAFEVKEIPAFAVAEVTLEKEARSVSRISDSTSLNEPVSVDNALKDKILIVTEDKTAEAPIDFSHHRTSSGSHLFSTVVGSSEAVNSVLSVKQEDVRAKTSEKANVCEVLDVEKAQIQTNKEAVDCMLKVNGKSEESDVPSVASSDIKDAGTTKCERNNSHDVALSDPLTSPVESVPVLATVPFDTKQKYEDQVTQLSSEGAGTVMLSGPKDKLTSEPARGRTNAVKKKKKKEIYSKADAAGTSDLYNAYKGPEEKHEIVDSFENVDSSSTVNTADVQADVPDKNAVAGEEDEQIKTEIDDWEDAADISTPKLRSEEGDPVHGNEATNKKRYSRDFLLTFVKQCTELPVGFEIGSDIADALMGSPVGTTHLFDRDSYPSPGRITDRSPGASRMDRRMAGVPDDDRWAKASSFGPGRDIRLDMGYGAANVSFRPGQGVNHGVLRNPRGQSIHFPGGILSGPMQSMPSQGGMPRSNSDADRWQRATGVQRGLIPSPHSTSQIMHKATNKYEVGKVSDIEEAKQRQLKAILNKLTPQNFDKLFLQVKEVNIDNTVTLIGVISQIFDKALTEPTFCEMYANFCAHLSNELPDFNEDNEKITFRRLLLNKCQEEFERGEREEAEANRAEEEGEIKQTEAQREEKRTQARRRMLGNIRLIGELYKKKMLTERIMHECIKKLLGEYENPDEEDVEALCKLMSTIGEMIDHSKAKVNMDAYFDRMLKLSTNQKLSSRVRFLLRDAIDLRKNKWQQRRKIEGPKKIDEVHRDAAQERQAQTSRLARGPVISSAPRRGPSVDYSSRSSSVLPSSQQVSSIRGMPAQVRGHAAQGVRMDDRHQFESRVLSTPLPQRSIDDSITLGPQGGLARGMSIRGQPLMSNAPSADIPPNLGDPRRLASGGNSHNFMSREDSMQRYTQDKFSTAQYDQTSPYGRSSSIGSRDPHFADNVADRSAATTIQGRIHVSSGILPAPSETMQLSEESLREKSISAIREFYSAKDEEEVALCIKELKSPSFYPSMVSLWVTDSFERKDKERDLLASLLVNLCKSRDNLLSQDQLVQGFVSVLSTLEDAVNDAPRAAEFLGHIFAKVTLEHIVPLAEIARLIREGGEEPGSLVDTGLASEVLGSILQFIRTDKGDSVLSEIRTSSGLRLEDFRPPHLTRSNKLDPFL
ncbi:eukaryotic translation initiation factor 4G [Iris pallida]|uniref:Eukaryotic translation initiation factor 4G n=1 Tax=Iris pallida TaxID=29817 RepID=A0AAX6DHL1_IRIPA|nr:eukaryotic translation initiation factor 4G [Iris pallida]